jgi:predicted MFS family arabinose efflux permease
MASPGGAASSDAPGASKTPQTPMVLWALMFGNFVIGTGVMLVPATLAYISADLKTSVALVGQLVSLAAVLMCLGAPLLAWWMAGWDRRRLLTFSIAFYGVMHCLCAAMPDFAWLLVVRIVTMLGAAVFTPQSAASVGLLVPPEQRGRAITFVFFGWSAASVLGLPLGALLGGTWGWRSAFLMVGLCGLASAIWVWRSMPDGVKPPAFPLNAWGDIFRSRALKLCLGSTLLYSAGQFVLFAYLGAYYKATLSLSPGQLGGLFAWFGVCGFVGSFWMSRRIDTIGTDRAVLLAILSMALTMLLWPLGSTLLLAAIVVIPWALGCFASNSAQQARLIGLAPLLAAGTVALNTSAMYAGQALGAAGGGWLIAHDSMDMLHWAGLVGLLLSATVSALASRAPKPIQSA